ncbi:toll/interleukin-1 receptor domain-containing protein [Nitrosomonas sp. Nm34]|uniref:toll/interleukin-1 receptor domain-containing protein n=1 Tax=Nitrosomonas sp. Nm34 TaxID=1881055 RepID=UPI0008E3E93D|nr:toll/interleukin-1 receptor domain-containing protein [Nitrosomonas sp. Nm34]SFI70951.1 TIR domain-containing protein [Nitrosomonas sp. Nm34]
MRNKFKLVWLSALASLASVAIAFIAILAKFEISGISVELFAILATTFTAFIAVLFKFIATRTEQKLWEKSIARYTANSSRGVEPKKMVFLSYAKEDRDRVSELTKALEEHNFNVWIDTKDLRPGENWIEAIQEGLKKSDYILPVLTANSVDKSGFAKSELKLYLDLRNISEKRGEEPKARIFPVMLDKGNIPNDLASYLYIDLAQPSGIYKLLNLLSSNGENGRRKPNNQMQPTQ